MTSGNAITSVDAGQYLVTSSQQLKLTQGEANFLRLDNLATLGTTGVVTVTNHATTMEGDKGGTLTLSANTEIKLECGVSSMSLKADGTIVLSGKLVKSEAGSSGVEVALSGVKASGATVTVGGGSVVDVSASVVKLN